MIPVKEDALCGGGTSQSVGYVCVVVPISEGPAQRAMSLHFVDGEGLIVELLPQVAVCRG